MSEMAKTRFKELALFVFLVFLFTWRIAGQEVVRFDSRMYLFALEMWRNGFSWFPTTYGKLYPDYPVTATALIYFCSLIFGGLTKFTAVLPSAMAGALTALITFKTGNLHKKRVGVFALLMLLTTVTFLKSARAISLDIYPALFSAWCFYLLHSATIMKKPGREKWVYALFIASFLFRGPIGLVMPTGVACVYYLIEKRIKSMICVGLVSLVLLVLLSAGLLGLAYLQGGHAFLQDVLRMEVAGRINNQYLPVYFYFTNSFFSYALTYPFALFAMLGVLVALWRHKPHFKDNLLLQFTGWALVILLGMSVPGDKKVRYVLPMAPALALICAHLWYEAPKHVYFAVIRRVLFALYFVLPSLLFVATLYVWHMADAYRLPADLSFSPICIFLGLLQIAICYFYYADEGDRYEQLSWVLATAATSFFIVNVFIIEPIEIYVERTREFVTAIEVMRIKQKAPLVFFKQQPDGMPIKYVLNMAGKQTPLFVENWQALTKLPRRAFVVTSASDFKRLSETLQKQVTIIANGKIGHKRVIIFQRK